MPAPMNTFGSISPRTAAWASREYLKHAQPRIVLAKLAQTKPLPQKNSDTAKFRRPVPFSADTTPLAEGVTPDSQSMSYEDVTVQVRQYGKVTTFTDWIQDTHEDPVLQHATMLMGEQAGATHEQIVYNAVKGGTNVFYANGAARNAVNTAVSKNKLRAVVRALQAQKSMKITRILSGSPDYETRPVEAAYVAVGHTDLDSDFRNIDGFIPVAKYGSKQTVSEHEIGSIEQVRIVLTPDLAPFLDAGGAAGAMVSNGGVNADVYPILIFGQDSFATVPLKGRNQMTPTVVNATPSDSDPLAQRSHVGYKFATAAVILNELWMARLEVAATDL